MEPSGEESSYLLCGYAVLRMPRVVWNARRGNRRASEKSIHRTEREQLYCKDFSLGTYNHLPSNSRIQHPMFWRENVEKMKDLEQVPH